MNLQEIEAAASRFKICPKCNSAEGFWLELKSEHAYIQCRGCGAKFELFEVYVMSEKGKTSERLRVFRK